MNTVIASNAFTQPDQLFNQPPPQHPTPQPATHTPRLYLIPETRYVPRQRAANVHIYDIPAPVAVPEPVVAARQGYWAREAQKFRQACSKLWQDVTEAGRKLAHRIMWWVVIPLGLISAFGIFQAEPAELPDGYYQVEVVR